MRIANRLFGVLLGAMTVFLFVPFSRAAAPSAVTVSKRRTSFNADWRFLKGNAEGAEQPQFDDSLWRIVRLPHDWAIEGPFDRKLNPHTGALPIFGTGWYRKSFTVPESAKGRYIAVEFDGAMNNSQVWLNGHLLGGRPYGYIGFEFDLTPFLKFGGETNVLAVRLTPEDRSSRWYPGAGIYRNVWLVATGPVHVAHWGTYVTTPSVKDDQATVSVKTDLVNRSDKPAEVTLRSSILNRDGRVVATADLTTSIPPNGTLTVPTTLNVAQPTVGH